MPAHRFRCLGFSAAENANAPTAGAVDAYLESGPSYLPERYVSHAFCMRSIWPALNVFMQLSSV